MLSIEYRCSVHGVEHAAGARARALRVAERARRARAQAHHARLQPRLHRRQLARHGCTYTYCATCWTSTFINAQECVCVYACVRVHVRACVCLLLLRAETTERIWMTLIAQIDYGLE